MTQQCHPYDYASDAGLRLDRPRGGAHRRPRVGHARRIVASIAVLGATAMIAGLATFASFTSSTTASHATTTGTVTVALGANGSTSNRLNVNATGVAPGDTIQRTVDVIGSGSLALAGTTLTTNATTSSVLDTDVTNGLQMVIDRCSTAWTEAGTAPAYTYTCSGTTSSVLASRAVIGSNLTLANMSTTPSTDHLRITLSLPTTAGNTFQGISSTINFQFTEAQRAGTSR